MMTTELQDPRTTIDPDYWGVYADFLEDQEKDSSWHRKVKRGIEKSEGRLYLTFFTEFGRYISYICHYSKNVLPTRWSPSTKNFSNYSWELTKHKVLEVYCFEQDSGHDLIEPIRISPVERTLAFPDPNAWIVLEYWDTLSILGEIE